MRLTNIFVSVLLILLLMSNNAIQADTKFSFVQRSGIITVETTQLTIEFRNQTNTPSFSFWENINTSNSYKLVFDTLFEIEDINNNNAFDLNTDSKIPATVIALASRNWKFTEVNTLSVNNEISEIHFNISTADEMSQGPPSENSNIMSIQFNIHMTAEEQNSLKFDVVIENYTFARNDAKLVLAFKLISNDENIKQSENNLRFGDAFFQSNTQANGTNKNIEVGLSHANENNEAKIYLTYDHFNTSLYHDPSIGIVEKEPISVETTTNEDSNTNISSNYSNEIDTEILSPNSSTISTLIMPEISNNLLISSTLITTIFFIAIPILIYKKR